jgi:hypothetical protein
MSEKTPHLDVEASTAATFPIHFPAGTSWSVAAVDNNGTVSPTGVGNVWRFDAYSPVQNSMEAAGYWTGLYLFVPGISNGISCVLSNQDQFEVYFLTPTRFIATKNNVLYRFGTYMGGPNTARD